MLALIAVINFLLIARAPGDPAAVMAGEAGAADEAFVAQLRERFGLDKPPPQQLATYLGHAARLDLGDSYRQQRPVMSLIGERLPATLLLTLTAFVVSLTLGVALGAWSSARAGTWLDSLVSTLSMLFYATPLFWLALMGVLLFSVKLEWLPGFGFETVWAGHAGLARGRHRPSPGAAGTLALLHGGVCPHDAHRHAGSGADGFHQDRPRQGPVAAPHPAPPHPAQRTAAGHHAGRHPGRLHGGRHGADRDRSPGPASAG